VRAGSPRVHAALSHVAENVLQEDGMNNLLRGGIAGFAAWKWGGGCFGTIILFLIVYWLLGHF
jgi:hypothetical protein